LSFSRVLSVILTAERSFHFQLGQNKTSQGLLLTTVLGMALTIFFVLVGISSLNDFLGHMG